MENLNADFAAIRRRADRKGHAHINYALRLEFFDEAATFCCTVGAGAILALSTYLMGNPDAPRLAEIIVTLIAAAISLIGVWQAVWRPGDRAKNHKAWSERFFKIKDHCSYSTADGEAPDSATLLARYQDASADADLIAKRIWRRSNMARKTRVGEDS